MKKSLLVLLFAGAFLANCFSNEINNKTIANQNTVSILNFEKQNTLFQDNNNSIQLFSSTAKFGKYQKQFHKAALAFTGVAAGGLALLITGAVLYGVSTVILTTSSGASGFLLYGGLSFIVIGSLIFSMMLPGLIVFWILYGLSKGSKKAMNIKASDKDLALCFGLKTSYQ